MPNADLLSLRILNTLRASAAGFIPIWPATPLARGGNAPGPHLSCKSASDSFVPSVSTITVPYHPGSTKSPRVSGTRIREDPWILGGGRMRNEERLTQRTTL